MALASLVAAQGWPCVAAPWIGTPGRCWWPLDCPHVLLPGAPDWEPAPVATTARLGGGG